MKYSFTPTRVFNNPTLKTLQLIKKFKYAYNKKHV